LSDVDVPRVGRDGSLLADLDGTPTLAAAEALVAAHLAGLEVVLVSGRTAAQLRGTGRLLGPRRRRGAAGAAAQWGGVCAGCGGGRGEGGPAAPPPPPPPPSPPRGPWSAR